ncbi:MAG: PEP-utilizing enzyme [Halieaceae bacterium]|jgi:phosphohistidine swiveling domain-containing protein|nr:PEP-utilizing enzyme [Halieaceae bacterium]
MSDLYFDSDKYGDESPSAVVASFHALIQAIVRQRFAESGMPWKDFVFTGAVDSILKEDFQRVETELLAAGHRFDWSAAISPRERPEAYKPAVGTSDADLSTFCFKHPDAPVSEADADGRELRGAGDNVVRYSDDISGTARYVRSTDRVLDWLTNGVPENTIAVIDDSGGTLTAPILGQFKGVICAGGTVRSHLGILTREYGIPCVMNAKVNGIMEGDTVVIEASAKAKTAEDYQTRKEVIARVWRVNS